jgi:hypothetical protein
MHFQAIMNGWFSSLLAMVILGAILNSLGLRLRSIATAGIVSTVVIATCVSVFALAYQTTVRRQRC